MTLDGGQDEINIRVPRDLAAQLATDISAYRAMNPIDDIDWAAGMAALDRIHEGLAALNERLHSALA